MRRIAASFLFVVALVALASSALASCGGDRDTPPPAASSTAPLPPPAAPSDLAAHVIIGAPRDVMPALRTQLGGAIAMWPGSFGSLVTSIAGLPITAAETVSDDAPLVATVLATAGTMDWVVAVHLRAADRLQSIATAGADAPYRAEALEGGLVHLIPVRPAPATAPSLAILGNHLLIGSTDAAIASAGAFTERAPPPALRPDELVAIEHGPAAALLARRIATDALSKVPRERLGAVGIDPAAWLTKLAPALDALDGGRTSLRFEDGRLRVEIAAGDSLLGRLAEASLPVSEAAGWLALPRDASVAVLFHVGGAGSAPIVPSDDLAASIGVVGARRDALGVAMTSLDHARSPALAVGAGVAPGGPALWFRTPLADSGAAKDALRMLVKALGEKPRKERPSVTVRETVVERVGDVVRLRVRVAGPDDRPPVDVLLRREDDLLLGATGLDAIAALQALRDAPDAARLGSDPFAQKLAASAPKHHALALVDLEGLSALARGKPRPERRVLVGASIAEAGGVVRLLLLAEPAAVPSLREMLASP